MNIAKDCVPLSPLLNLLAPCPYHQQQEGHQKQICPTVRCQKGFLVKLRNQASEQPKPTMHRENTQQHKLKHTFLSEKQQ